MALLPYPIGCLHRSRMLSRPERLRGREREDRRRGQDPEQRLGLRRSGVGGPRVLRPLLRVHERSDAEGEIPQGRRWVQEDGRPPRRVDRGERDDRLRPRNRRVGDGRLGRRGHLGRPAACARAGRSGAAARMGVRMRSGPFGGPGVQRLREDVRAERRGAERGAARSFVA